MRSATERSHGLGIEVHEDPQISKAPARLEADDDGVAPGMVFTIEPGAYFPDWGGVRIERRCAGHRNGSRSADSRDDGPSGGSAVEDGVDLDQLRQILTLVQEHELSGLEFGAGRIAALRPQTWRWRSRTRRRCRRRGNRVRLPLLHPRRSRPSRPAAVSAPTAAEQSRDRTRRSSSLRYVGTFYRSPEPGAASFVEIGSAVKKGRVLCIIEAMKLMNEIDSGIRRRSRQRLRGERPAGAIRRTAVRHPGQITRTADGPSMRTHVQENSDREPR